MYCCSKPGCKNCCVSHALTPLNGLCATDYVLNPAFVLKVLAQLVKPHNADADTASIMVVKCVLMHSIGVRGSRACCVPECSRRQCFTIAVGTEYFKEKS